MDSKIQGSVITILSNINQNKSRLSHLLENDATIQIILNYRLEYKWPYVICNIHPDLQYSKGLDSNSSIQIFKCYFLLKKSFIFPIWSWIQICQP